MTWETVYNYFGITDFIYFISNPQIQDTLFPVKLVFMTFAMFFLAGVIYFMINSSWLQYNFLEDVTEFFSWKSSGLREISKHWKKIKQRAESGSEAEYKLSIIEAEDFLVEVLDERGYEETDFAENIKKAAKLITPLLLSEILSAHEVRNAIVYNPDYKLDAEQTKKVLGVYEAGVNAIGVT